MKQILMNKAKVAVVKNTVAEIITNKINQRVERGVEEKYDAFFVGDMGDIVRKHKIWTAQLPRVEPFYAVKCNDDATILATLAELGTGFDCASKGEIQKIVELHVPNTRIIYANPCKQSSHIKYAAKNNVEMMTFDNETELHKVHALHPGAKMVVRILPPANTKCQCQLGMKFGCHPKKVAQLLHVAKELGVDVIGVSFHVGSGCYDAMAYSAAVASARTIFNLAAAEGFNFTLLDIGGGFPGQKNAKLPFEEICSVLRPALDMYFPENMNVRIIAEPGRFYVASAFTLAVNVIARRIITHEDNHLDDEDNADSAQTDVESCSNETASDTASEADAQEVAQNVDAEIPEPAESRDPTYMYYVNDGVYGSFNCILFDHATVTPVLYDEERFENEPRYTCSLWGPTCDGLDCLTRDSRLPELNTGDWLLFEDMGAYTMSAASNFNGMPKPKCYHVIHEADWVSLCQQGGIESDLLPSMKTGHDATTLPITDPDADVPPTSSATTHQDCLLLSLEA